MMSISDLCIAEDDSMNWFGNISSDSDQPVSAACLMQGHWRHRPHPYAEPMLCRVVIDVDEPRVVAAQFLSDGVAEDLDDSALDELTQEFVKQDVMFNPSAWGFSPCNVLPAWARPSFSDQQIEELKRIEGYLIEATDDTIDAVLHLRDEFLRGIGVTDHHLARASGEPEYGATVMTKGSRLLS